MSFTLTDIADMARGTLILPYADYPEAIENLSTDSRTLQKPTQTPAKTLFIALQGERFDAHTFIPALIAQQAPEDSPKPLKACMVNQSWWNQHQRVPANLAFIVVPDTGMAYLTWGKSWAKRWQEAQNGRCLIALSGSNGKTSTKEMIRALAEETLGKDAVLATEGNLNNAIGLPSTLLRLRDHHRWAVVELGINHPGEMAMLTEGLSPDIALITNAGRAHLQGMDTVQKIAEEKGQLYRAIRQEPRGWALINRADPFQVLWEKQAGDANIKGFGNHVKTKVAADAHFGQTVTTLYRGELMSFRLPMVGAHQALNAMAALAVAEVLMIPAPKVVQALSHLMSVKGRLTLSHHPSAPNLTLIDDTYNANPESMKKAIETLTTLSAITHASQPCRSIIALGDMGETGKEAPSFHRELQQRLITEIKAHTLSKAIVLGEHHQHVCASEPQPNGFITLAENHQAMAAQIIQWAVEHLPQPVLVLVKGSRYTQMEKVVEAIKAHTDFSPLSQLDAPSTPPTQPSQG